MVTEEEPFVAEEHAGEEGIVVQVEKCEDGLRDVSYEGYAGYVWESYAD